MTKLSRRSLLALLPRFGGIVAVVSHFRRGATPALRGDRYMTRSPGFGREAGQKSRVGFVAISNARLSWHSALALCPQRSGAGLVPGLRAQNDRRRRCTIFGVAVWMANL
jgi:hypothetical protein